MKEIIILIVVLMLVFIPNFSFKHYLERSGKELINIVKEMEEKMKNKDVKESDAIILKKEFLAKEKIWIMIVDHDMLDEIEHKVEDCVGHYNLENKQDFFSTSYQLCDEIEDLSKREEISWGNII